MNKYVLFVIATSLMICFQNCSKIAVEDLANHASDIANLDNGGSSPSAPGIESDPVYLDLKMNCEKATKEGRIKTRMLTVSFPNAKKQCDWGVSGNFAMENGKIRARREQKQILDLSLGSRVCSLNMVNNVQSQFFYDDNIFLNLNGFILASTSNFSRHLENKNGFYKYDWLRLRDQDAQNSQSESELEDQYCAGSDTNISSCSFPVTETYGAVKLQFKDEVFQKILAMTKINQVELNMVTTGDNNPDTDCQHVDINFSVEVSYYE